MPDQILKDVTHLASTLADQATKQLDSVLKELSGNVGDGRNPGDPPHRVNMGTMAFNVLQLASKVGEVLQQLSDYDLVRKNTPVLTLKSSNPLSAIELPAKTEYRYDLLIENEGIEELQISIQAQIVQSGKEPTPLELDPDFGSIYASERRHLAVTIPVLPKGKHALIFTVTTGKKEVIGKKVIELIVYPAPKQHET